MFFVLLGEFRRTERFAVFEYHVSFPNLRELFFEDGYGVVHCDRYDQTVGFGCQTETSLMKVQQIQVARVPVSGSLREDTYRDTGFDQVDTCQDGLQTFFDVFPVKEETMEIAHPV